MSEKRKNKNGKGNITYNKKRNCWDGYVGYTTPSGEHKKKHFSAKTKKEVTEKIEKFNEEERPLLTGGHKSSKTYPCFKDYAKKLLEIKEVQLKGKSYNRIFSTYNTQIKNDIIDKMRMNQITFLVVQDFALRLQTAGYSSSTIKKAVAFIKQCFDLYNRENNLYGNPVEGIKIKSTQSVSRKYLKENEVSVLIDELFRKKSNSFVYQYRYVFLILLLTGMRLGELLALKWEDIDFDEGTCHIHSDLSEYEENGKTVINIQPPKTERSNRTIRLSAEAISVFSAMKDKANSEFVVVSSKGTLVPQQRIDRSFKRIVNNCNLSKDFTPHCLRHTFATLMYKENMPLEAISKYLGHASTEVTRSIYVHIFDEITTAEIIPINVLEMHKIAS